MLEYLKAAFRFGVAVPGLGRLPVNLLLLAAFAILGFGNPGFWLLGAAFEAAWLAALATNPRFQRVVAARRQAARIDEAERGREDLLCRLDPAARQRYAALEAACERALQAGGHEGHAESDVDGDGDADADLGRESSRDALSRLKWIFLKLLVARFRLDAASAQSRHADLRGRVDELERGLQDAALTPALRESRTATLKIFRQRLENQERTEQKLEEVDADLARIEAQVDLALENASMQGGGAVVSANLELASRILDDEKAFGDWDTDVAAVDRTFDPAPTLAPRDATKR